MKESTRLSRRQLLTVVWVGLLSPLVRQAPLAMVKAAGHAAWVAPLLALLPLLGLTLLLQSFLQRRGAEEGLGDQLCKALGERPGRLALLFITLWLLPLCSLLLIIMLLCISTVGSFGAELTARMYYPFFVMMRNLRFFNLLERIEAFLISQWVVTDFIFVSLLQVCTSNLARVFQGGYEQRRRWAPGCAVVAVLAGFFCASSSFALQELTEHLIPLGNAVVLFGVLPAIYLVGKVRDTI